MSKKVIVIGSGFAGLSAATTLSRKGFDVTVLEKNEQLGGRARSFSSHGYTYDMGPSWYWMPDVFEDYFNSFGRSVSDYYDLIRLDPSYRVYFGKQDYMDMPSSVDEMCSLFESIEAGSGDKLRQFLAESAYKYEVGIKDLVYKPGRSLLEFADWRVLKGLFQMHLLKSMRKYARSFFSNPRLLKLIEFPILFLGATPEKTPALYSMMNYADMALGTWYPQGGMNQIIQAMVSLAKAEGVEFKTNEEVLKLEAHGHTIDHVITSKGTYKPDFVVAGADYHHVEQKLLDKEYRKYTEDYWDKREMAPSSLILYMGVSKKVKGLLHHTLFFDEDFDIHAKEIYENPEWPSKPLFYTSATSKTDPSAAPAGHENLFLLMPVAPGLNDEEAVREKYSRLLIDRLEGITGSSIANDIDFKRSYAHSDFERDYHSFKGNAYGLANTLRQTAILKPSIRSNKLSNLFYTGQLTVPGPGVPPALISGRVVAKEIQKELKKTLI